MMLRKGDLVRPVHSRHCYRGGTLAIVIANPPRQGLQILWLNGGLRGTKTWDYVPRSCLFEKVTE